MNAVIAAVRDARPPLSTAAAGWRTGVRTAAGRRVDAGPARGGHGGGEES